MGTSCKVCQNRELHASPLQLSMQMEHPEIFTDITVPCFETKVEECLQIITIYADEMFSHIQ